jgi:hypothetical protein
MSGTETSDAGSTGAGSSRARAEISHAEISHTAILPTAISHAVTPHTGIPRAEVCGRDRAVLRAVAAGRCQLRAGCEPLLVVDGVGCADSAAARRLIAAGLLAPPTRVAERARLTDAGRAALVGRA